MRFAERLTVGRAVLLIGGVAVVLTTCAAALMRVVEPETFDTFGDAGWWALQTVSTVGYGDQVPVTGGGRTIAAVLMLLGIAFVPAITSIVVAILVAQLRQRRGVDSDLAERLEQLERKVDTGRD